MKKKIYPEIEVDFGIVDKDSLHINFTTFGECNKEKSLKYLKGMFISMKIH
jgi:hypothetical protein